MLTMRKLYLFILFASINNFTVAQTDATHWTQLINKPQVNYFEIKKAFEKDQQQSLDFLNANGQLNAQNIEKDSLGNIKENKEGFYNLFKRWEYFVLPRLDKNGNFDASKESNSWKAYLDDFNSKKKQSKIANVANWQPIGPYKATSTTYANSGRVECIAFHPTNANIFYIGAPDSGVWKTIDGGVNWQYLSQSWNDQRVTGLAINPTNPSIIYALKYNNYFMKSIDAGLTWTQINITIGTGAVDKLLINPDNPQILLANSYSGVIRSVNGGTTWTYAAFSTGYTIEDIKFKPGDPNVVYANSRSVVYKSTDGGITFNSIYTLPTTSIAANIAVTAAAPNNLYVAYNSNLTTSSVFYRKFGAVYKSTNGGSTFTTITDDNTPVDTQTMGTQGYHQGRYDLTLAVSPTDANEIWLGMVPMFKTINGGASWNSVGSNNVSVHVDHHAAEFQPITGKMFIGCDGGLYRYTHATNTYEILDGMNITQMYRLSAVKDEKSKILYGAQDNGTHKWESNTYKSIFGGDGMECIIDHTNTNTLYSSVQLGYLFKSTDNGVNWNGITPSPFPSNAQWVTPWEMDPTNNQVMYACYREIYKTTNGGTTWSPITNQNLNQSFNFVKIAPSNTNILYAYSGDYSGSYNLIKSTNGGASWTALTLPESNFGGRDLTIDANDPNKIWVIGYQSVFSSIDGGLNWTNIKGTLPNIGFNCIINDKTNADLYLGTYNGVFVRPNGSSDWTLFSDNLPKVNIQELEISYTDGNILRAATYGRGLWETPVYTPCSVPVATLTANGPIVIPGGGTVTLQANTGSGLTYQWYKDGAKIVGSVSSSYVVNDIGVYQVIVKNANCSKYSNSITVTTSATLVLNAIPASVCKGSNLSIPFTATNFASGTTFTIEFYDVTYDTYVQFTATGTTSPLSINLPSYYNLNGNYKVRLKANSPSISIVSNQFQVKNIEVGIGNDNGNIFTPSGASFSLCTGKSVKLYALKYSNTMPNSAVSYQWKFNGVDINTAVDSTLTVSAVGTYTVNVSQVGCSKLTPSVSINNSTNIGGTLRAVGSSSQCTNVLLESIYKTTTSTFQWKKNGVTIPSATTFSYNATTSGFYTVTASDGAGCTISPANREVKIGKLPASITSSDSVICNTNGYGYLTYTSSSPYYDNVSVYTNGLIYQWQKNGVDIPNANQSYFYAYSSDGGGAYTLKLKQQTCESISNPFFIQLSNILPPAKTYTSPAGTNFCTGQSIGLGSTGGTGGYIWQRNGVDVVNSSYYNATTSGTYVLRRTQGTCTSTSAPITLNFGSSYVPSIYVSYNASKTCNGTYLNLSNSAPSGSTYQWRRNGVNISGSTNNYVYANSSGNYDVVISGTCGGTSNSLAITVGSIEAEIIPSSNPIYCKNAMQKLTLSKVDNYNSQFQWKKDGVNITGATVNELLVDAPGNYTVAVTQGTCSFTSPAYIILTRELSTATLIGSTTINAGQTGTITANLTGLPPWGLTLSDGSFRYVKSSPFSVSFTPTTTQTYSIQSLTDGCALGCVPKWTITTASNLSWETYHALQMIESVSKIISPANIDYRAGQSVNLSPGFDTQNGTVFKAEIGGCNN